VMRSIIGSMSKKEKAVLKSELSRLTFDQVMAKYA
jgi:hypothetical protein